MARSRMNKIKTSSQTQEEGDAFFMSLEEAKQAIAEQYGFLQDRYERSKEGKKRPV